MHGGAAADIESGMKKRGFPIEKTEPKATVDTTNKDTESGSTSRFTNILTSFGNDLFMQSTTNLVD